MSKLRDRARTVLIIRLAPIHSLTGTDKQPKMQIVTTDYQWCALITHIVKSHVYHTSVAL